MPTIYATGQYLIIDDGTNPQLELPKNLLRYWEDSASFYLTDRAKLEVDPIAIAFTDSSSWDNESATAYSTATLRTLLQENTGS